jgi:hypothetical protein
MTDNADQTQFLTDLPRAERDATVVLDAPLFPPSFGRSPVADPPTIELAWSDVAALREQAGAEHPALQPAPLTGQSAELPLAEGGPTTQFLPNPWDLPESPPTTERRRPGLSRRVLLLTGALAAAGLLALALGRVRARVPVEALEPA